MVNNLIDRIIKLLKYKNEVIIVTPKNIDFS